MINFNLYVQFPIFLSCIDIRKMGKLGKNLWQRLNSSQSDRMLMLEASVRIRKSLISSILNLECELGINQSMSELLEYQKELVTKKAETKGSLVLWLTINPKNTIKLKDFMLKVDKFAKRKMFTKYFYVFEQRGRNRDEVGKGFHCHLLLWRCLSYPPSKIITNSKNTFKNICFVNRFEIFNYHYLAPKMIEDKLKYITEQKYSDDKKLKQSFDSLWRVNNNINSYYSSNEGLDKGEPSALADGFDDSNPVSHEM